MGRGGKMRMESGFVSRRRSTRCAQRAAARVANLGHSGTVPECPNFTNAFRGRIYEQSVVKRANVFMKRVLPSIYPASSRGTCHLINPGPAAIQIDEVLVGL